MHQQPKTPTAIAKLWSCSQPGAARLCACHAQRPPVAVVRAVHKWKNMPDDFGLNLSGGRREPGISRQRPSDSAKRRKRRAGLRQYSLPRHWAEHLNKLSNSVKRRRQAKWMERVEAVNDLEPSMQRLSNEELLGKTEEFKMRLASQTDTVDSLLPEAFAAVREASKRILNLRHFDVQLLGGMALHEGKIAEINTGEGKTLVATLPAYLEALLGKGVHIVTVNDYLAARDAHWMGRVFEALGMSVGVVTDHIAGPENQAAFDADITYVTATNLGWLYLHDNSNADKAEHLTIRRPFHYAIVDEADSVLIDDAVQPLITSKLLQGRGDNTAWMLANQVALLADWEHREEISVAEEQNPSHMPFRARLWNKGGPWDLDKHRAPEGEVQYDPRSKQLVITDAGHRAIVQQLERLGHKFPEAEKEGRKALPGDLWGGRQPLGQYIHQSLRACLFWRGKDYLVKGGQVAILNQNTGRTVDSSRWSNGLHQAIEAKEGVQPRSLDVTYGSITYQLLFSLYPRMAGMTGTAESAEDEFLEMYQRSVEVIPPHKPSQRTDRPVEIFVDPFRPASARFSAKQTRALLLVHESLRKGQPVLIGTHSVEESEEWADLLASQLISCQVLNATPSAVEREAEIIAQAGMPRTSPAGEPCITIATSLAGRGTDIRLGGDAKGLMQMALRSLLLPFMLDFSLPQERVKLGDQETCPLDFWPRDAVKDLHSLARHLPPQVFAALKSAATGVMGAFFDQSQKLPYATSRKWLAAGFEATEALVPRFLLTARKEFGDLESVADTSLFGALGSFLDAELPVHSLSSDEQAGAQSRVQRAAVLLWIWLEIRYCPLLAAEARAAGGLRVMCTSMAPTWRVWDQLKGRSGRQGDPGETLVLLSWDADLSMDPTLWQSFPRLLAHASGDEPLPLPSSLTNRLILRPAMAVRESIARDGRSQSKKSDEVLHTVRQQLYSFRRWILSAQPQQLRGLIRTYCFEVAATLVKRHVDPKHHPGRSDSWHIQQLMAEIWQLVDGCESHQDAGADAQLQITAPVQGLFGVTMPQPGILDFQSLQAAADQLRASLLDHKNPKPPAVETAGANCSAIQEELMQTRRSYLDSQRAKDQSFPGRYADKAVQLVDYLACALYLAWMWPKRQQLKLILQLSTPRETLIYDSTCESAPQAAKAGGKAVVDLEEMIQDWERKCFADSLTELWVSLLADSTNSWHAANITTLSRLTPIQEYTSAMSRRFVQLLDDHRPLSMRMLFAGPNPLYFYESGTSREISNHSNHQGNNSAQQTTPEEGPTANSGAASAPPALPAGASGPNL